MLDGETLCTESGDAVCFASSEEAKKHFAADGDGNGLERGKLTWAIAYRRGKGTSMEGFRFNAKQRSVIERHYQRFLRPDCDFIVFNNKFFDADVRELKGMAEELEIRV